MARLSISIWRALSPNRSYMAAICGSAARSFGRKMRVGPLSTMAGAMLLASISARLCVANTTLAFFFRKVFSHSRSWAAKSGLSRTSQPSSMMISVGEPSSRPSIRWKQVGQDGGRRAGADQPLRLERLDRRLAETLELGVEQLAPRATDAIRRKRLLQFL